MGLEPTTSSLGIRAWIINEEFGVYGGEWKRRQVAQFQQVGFAAPVMEPFWSHPKCLHDGQSKLVEKSTVALACSVKQPVERNHLYVGFEVRIVAKVP